MRMYIQYTHTCIYMRMDMQTYMCFILSVVHYFLCRLKVTIEREIAPDEQGILFYLMVTKDSTIEQLQLMVCTCHYGANRTG